MEHSEHSVGCPCAHDPATIERELEEVAALYRVFGDKTRVSLLHALLEREKCVNELAGELGMTLSAVSHQLRVLKQAHLVRSRKEGKAVYYAPDDEHVRTILMQGLDHVRE
ncbi:MAG: helix-turn-helix transcriptional regulator [Clostridia bacterium]|nr:helix-turn-helix transcriptional regulator [Clostridia bacterium]